MKTNVIDGIPRLNKVSLTHSLSLAKLQILIFNNTTSTTNWERYKTIA